MCLLYSPVPQMYNRPARRVRLPQLLPFYELISLGLYSAMLVTTVLTLKKGHVANGHLSGAYGLESCDRGKDPWKIQVCQPEPHSEAESGTPMWRCPEPHSNTVKVFNKPKYHYSYLVQAMDENGLYKAGHDGSSDNGRGVNPLHDGSLVD